MCVCVCVFKFPKVYSSVEDMSKLGNNNLQVIRGNLTTDTVAGLKRSKVIFVCVEVLRPSQPNGVMSSAVSLPNHTFTGQA